MNAPDSQIMEEPYHRVDLSVISFEVVSLLQCSERLPAFADAYNEKL